MTKQVLFFSLALAFCSAYCTSESTDKETASASSVSLETEEDARPFEKAKVRFEQNATDVDVEVVFEVLGGNEGLLKLQILAPDDRMVVDFTAPDPTTTGIRSFTMESPEPKDVSALKAAYPAGVYKFAATDAKGTNFRGEATLNHSLPDTAIFLNPVSRAKNIPVDNLTISWNTVENVVKYIVEVEIEEKGLSDNITAELPETATSFPLPNHFLRPGSKYKAAIGTVSAEGNISFVEIVFSTEGEAETNPN